MIRATRLVSLDILRGWTVIGMIVVNAAAGLGNYPVPAPMLHSHWIGLTFADLVFPAFVFVMGVSIAVSMPSGRPDAALLRRIAWRSLRLIVLGIALSNIYWLRDYDQTVFRWPGVLQRLGVVFLIAAPMHLLMSTRAIVASAIVMLLAYWGICLLPVPDGTPADLHVAGANFVSWVDRAVFGMHVYVRQPLAYDPEGLLSTVPAIAQALFGVIAGRCVRAAKTSVLPGAAIAAVTLGLLWSLALPISKELWSPSFVLVTSGITLALFAVLHRFVDVRGRHLWGTTLWSAFGINAIAAYVLHELMADMLGWKSMDVVYRQAAQWIGPQPAIFIPIAIFLGLVAWAMLALQRRGWTIRI